MSMMPSISGLSNTKYRFLSSWNEPSETFSKPGSKTIQPRSLLKSLKPMPTYIQNKPSRQITDRNIKEVGAVQRSSSLTPAAAHLGLTLDASISMRNRSIRPLMLLTGSWPSRKKLIRGAGLLRPASVITSERLSKTPLWPMLP